MPLTDLSELDQEQKKRLESLAKGPSASKKKPIDRNYPNLIY